MRVVVCEVHQRTSQSFPGERLDERAHPIEALADGVAGLEAVVDPLEDHGELVRRERAVPAEVGDADAGPLGVDLDELVEGRVARGGVDGARHRAGESARQARDVPVQGEDPEVDERVAERRHLPVEDRRDVRRRRPSPTTSALSRR